MSRPPGSGTSTTLLWPPESKSSKYVGREGGRGPPSPAGTQRGRLRCAVCLRPLHWSPPQTILLAAQPPQPRKHTPGPGRVSLQRRTSLRCGVQDFTRVSNSCTQHKRLDLQGPARTPIPTLSRDPPTSAKPRGLTWDLGTLSGPDQVTSCGAGRVLNKAKRKSLTKRQFKKGTTWQKMHTHGLLTRVSDERASLARRETQEVPAQSAGCITFNY